MAPIDLLTMLNAPFASLKSLQVPALTNALVGVCADTLTYYAGLQRAYVATVGNMVLNDGEGGGKDGTPLPNSPSVAAEAVCAVLNNAERTIEMIDQVRSSPQISPSHPRSPQIFPSLPIPFRLSPSLPFHHLR